MTTTGRTARIPRTQLPQPTTTATVGPDGYGGDIEAVQALYDAYMALNATGRGALAWEDGPAAPMALTAKAAKAALARFPGVSTRDARIIWDAMCDGGSGVKYCYDLWRNSEI